MDVTRTLRNQVLATTHLDAHGERLSKADLHNFFRQTDDPSLLYYNHDMSHPPVARLRNKRFVETPDGEFTLIADVDILDEDAYARWDGFSISFASHRGEALTPDVVADLTIHVDLRVFEYEVDIRPILQISDEHLIIAARELKRKALDEVAILVLTFVSGAVASGFFGEPGAEAYKALKERLTNVGRNVRSRHNTSTSFHLRFPMRLKGWKIDVLVDLAWEHLEISDRKELDMELVKEYIRREIGDSVIRQIALQVLPESPYLRIKYFIDDEGEIVTLR